METISNQSIWKDIEKIRTTAPLVHNITNYVVMNTTANALLSLGASPVMAHAEEEVEEMVKLASALVINIGTLSPHWVRGMFTAMQKAAKQQIPIILDPVGAGATRYRTKTAHQLIEEVSPSIIRGNASEIMALAGETHTTKGVDSSHHSEAALEAANHLHEKTRSVICISGAIDIVVSNGTGIRILNGHPLMSRVTGMGCTASALCGAFAAVNNDWFKATAHAMAVMGIVGEMAAEKSHGPGSLQFHFLDMLTAITLKDIENRLRWEVLK